MHNFPPIGGPRSFRWLNFVKILSAKGWSIDVLTVRPSPNDSFYDASLLKDIPENVRVFRSYPGIFYSIFHRSNKTVKGFNKATIEWFPFGWVKGLDLLAKQRYDLIISSALPFVGHLVGYVLKKKAKIPWVADYGDPLAFNPLTSPVKRFVGKFVEGGVLKAVDGVIVPFEEMKDEFLEFYPFLHGRKFKSISQGIPESFGSIKKENYGQKFVLSYVGSFYKDVHEPFEFFKALQTLRSYPKLIKDIVVVIAGNTEQKYVDCAKQLKIDGFTKFLGQVSFNKAVSILKGSSAILYIGGRRNDYHFPSKVLVYAATNRPIIAIQQSRTDLGADFIRKNQLGFVVSNDQEKIEKVIEDLYRSWEEKEIDTKFNKMSKERFFWKIRGEELLDFIVSVLEEYGS
jgi:hypothetical protein